MCCVALQGAASIPKSSKSLYYIRNTPFNNILQVLGAVHTHNEGCTASLEHGCVPLSEAWHSSAQHGMSH